MQVEYGLVCDSDGRPVAIEAFEGSLNDDKTLPSQVKKLERRFGLRRVIVVTDRGIGTKDNVTLVSQTAEFGFITALKAPQAPQGGDPAAVDLRRAGPGRDRLRAGVPRPAVGGLPKPDGGRRPRAQALRAAHGHREGSE
jgi:hypothetical protein